MTIILLPFERADFSRLIGWVPTAEFLMLWSGPFFTYPLNEAQLEAYYQSAQSAPLSRCIYKAVDTTENQVVGHIELNNLDWHNLSATVSKVLVGLKSEHNKGYGTQMIQTLVEIAFDQYGLHRLELRVFDFNKPAIRCYQKVGFQIEGHLRDYRKVGDAYWSSYLMSLLESDGREKMRTKPS
jgi:RimJ/RimL family protein N-acetyltransferase